MQCKLKIYDATCVGNETNRWTLIPDGVLSVQTEGEQTILDDSGLHWA